ncbi:UL16-binding protein 1-like [Bos indicus x Bos taurus]|uniref:UL16-binding protein 1-like n=1 Tax=Bos indicus x Bos taurus TaxID=30522 RepID=UPI000F7D29C4|nr:UL16-binding protein 1-like [Bos indicus x Bos taurus]
MCLLFDLENGHWTEVHSGGRRMREKWEKDRAVSNFFKKVSMGDCQAWLRDFLVRWKEMLKTTASPAEAPLRVNSSAPAIRHITWILPVLLTSFIITSSWAESFPGTGDGAPRKRDRCSVCLSPALHFRSRRSDPMNPESVFRLR